MSFKFTATFFMQVTKTMERKTAAKEVSISIAPFYLSCNITESNTRVK